MLTEPLASFPGIQAVAGLSFSFSHGILPSVATLISAPQEDFEAAGGTLSIFDGQNRIDFPDCKVDRHALDSTAQGQIWRLQILDRRWKWKWGYLSGSYNLRNDDNTIRQDAGNEQTPQQLAALCLQAMGETDFDVGQMPNDARPTVEWDIAVPAEALQQLCDDLGCRVILRLDNSVSIEPDGEGAELDENQFVIDDGLTIDPPEQPDTLSIACGRDRFQVDFLLEAVGLNNDNTIVPIGSLSYMPAAGWGNADLPTFTCVTDNYRERAKSSVLRWYRIKVPVTLPDYGAVPALDQLLPIEDEQVEVTSLDNVIQNKAAQVYGCFFPQTESLRNNIQQSAIDPNNFDGTVEEYRKPFTIDRDFGLVKFDDYVFLNQSDGGGSAPAWLTIGPAVLRLRVAVSVRDPNTRAPVRWHRDRSYGNNFDTPTRYIKHDEIVQTHVPKYDTNFNIQSVTTNIDDVNQRCDYYLDAAEQEYQVTFPQTIRYAGVQSIELDGAIRQITWQIDSGGATTTVSRNDEQLQLAPSYEEKRALARTRQLKQLAQAQQPAVMRQNLKAIPVRR